MDINVVSFATGESLWGARPPEGFPHRFAVLTWLTLGGDASEPWRLLRLVAPDLVRLTAADAAVAEFWRRRRSLLRGWRTEKVGEEPLLPYLDRDDRAVPDDVAFPSGARFERDGAVVLRMETESWDAVGGPAPYHDSVTLSFSSASDLSRDLERLFRRAAARAGAEVRDPGPR